MSDEEEATPPYDREEEVQRVIEMVDSMTVDGKVYVNASVLQSIHKEGWIAVTTLLKSIAEELGIEDAEQISIAQAENVEYGDRAVGYIVGITEICTALSVVISALQRKHADEMTISIDDLLDDISSHLEDNE